MESEPFFWSAWCVSFGGIVRAKKTMWRVIMVSSLVLGIQGCMGHYELDRKPVKQLSEAEVRSRSRAAYDRARGRIGEIRDGMDPGEVQAALGAVIAVEDGDGNGAGGRRKLIDGFLCRVNAGPLRERWLFGYDEGNVQMVGFAVEFVRQDADDDGWVVKRVDRTPGDDCPVVGDTYLE
jgi:hypothetical protein